ncbi:hypothetical protein ACSS6W_008947 [Trichoderma asperelloides]
MGTRKGCYQCNKRRIVCDMGEPRCLKCTNKGLECSGNGLRYRFNNGIASRGKLRGLSIPIDQSCPPSTTNRSSPRKQSRQDTIIAPKSCRASKGVIHRSISDNKYEVGVLPCLESTDSNTRLLLDYFSINMAPGMVVLDSKNNGYRNLILPFAVQDKLVRQAVMSIAGLQFARTCPEMHPAAELSRAQVIKQLMQSSISSAPEQVFNISSWMTVLVLLIGELALGGDHYSYLLRMMCSIKDHGVVDPNPELVRFLTLETNMISYLARPFVDDSSDVENMESEKSLQSLLVESQGPKYNNAEQEILNIVTEAAQVCYEICKDCNFPQRREKNSNLQHLKRLVSQVLPCTAGGNSMVWVYFIGAADSDSFEDQSFFIGCLIDIYNYTGWENIARGISMLEQIWQRPPGRSWRYILPQLSTAFVM